MWNSYFILASCLESRLMDELTSQFAIADRIGGFQQVAVARPPLMSCRLRAPELSCGG